ncbi:cytochrome ubiquinol oxidase subunit I [Salinisphaera sp. USBA-960]|uniref:cytochrome ubiquinol oxidase subunit I n=1 Tax=Salinisphaera orenii TaxID=856731 RepID=UPI000DBE495E|nr:cytochrome ubiquinol oxidase subunit I [Salifodinibacter halophilus]NNC25940.1 cytochrome ubiquinol oxidase subunit I [Salifodinibacter halophilus]
MDQSLAVFLTRIDFAWVTSLHFLYPPLTIGLSVLLLFSEWRWLRSDDEYWYRLVRFFEKLFIINFGAGVATGVTMEMAFGILYGPFSQAAGPYFGNVLGYETITAFMYEAGFIGLMIFGWGKISRGMHLFATFNVMLSSSLSAFWIMNANSWMHTPTGVELRDGIFHVTDWGAAIFNPNFLTAFPHMWVASLELALFFVAGVSAWFVLKGRHIALFQRPLKYALLAALVVTPLQIYVGDELGMVVGESQPSALASMEGHYKTYSDDGSANTGWHLLGWPDAEGEQMAWSVTIPQALSLIETRSFDSTVPGLDQFKPENTPPVGIPFYAFRMMVAIGGFLFLVALWGGWLICRKRLTVSAIAQNRWFLRVLVFSAFLPFLAIWTGWWAREIARQPWLVFGMMRVSEGVSKMTVFEASLWLVGFTFFELIVWYFTWYFLAKVIREGPDMDSPVVYGGDEALGHLEEAPETDEAQPTYVRP